MAAQDGQKDSPKPGTPEHDQAMADLSDKRTREAAGDFEDEGSAPPADTPKDESKDAAKESEKDIPKDESKDADEEAARKVAEDAGLDFDSLSQEYAETGALSEESYTKLAEQGIPKEMVDDFIEGQKARAELRDMSGFALAGGEEEYGKMVQWATQNLTVDEIEEFNKSVDRTSSAAAMQSAIKGLRARYEADQGTEPALLGGDRSSGDVDGFESRAQMTEAMSKLDSRGRRVYDRDPAYRRQMERRIAASKFF
jgi:hypothetical protein